jgi:hypothetical protein
MSKFEKQLKSVGEFKSAKQKFGLAYVLSNYEITPILMHQILTEDALLRLTITDRQLTLEEVEIYLNARFIWPRKRG